MAGDPEHPFVSRGGLKLAHALDTFALDVTGLACADLGCSTGGFTDCLLQRGARSVVCVDTAYGQLAWKLRQDERTTVMERTNVLHADPVVGGVDLVVMDLGWTPQRLAIPAAARWLGAGGQVISLIKPHYELSDREGKSAKIVLDEEQAERVAQESLDLLESRGFKAVGLVKSPILGGGNRSKSAKRGNPEWLALIEKKS
jgi:23S rRNA (cytidine1920-2'-O)/16S rRNA (cytidine1409-2'-O)-methyltransferase